MKVVPLLESLKKNKNFNKALSERMEKIFYTDQDIKSFIKKKQTRDYEIHNKNNKENIKKIEEIKQNINKKEYEDIKDNILILSNLFKSSLKEIYIQYISFNQKDKLPKIFETLENLGDRQRKEGKDDDYIGELYKVASDLVYNVKK